MAFPVPDLPYPYDALEPHIDEQTMRVHHDKHHQAYVDKANGALEVPNGRTAPSRTSSPAYMLPEDMRTTVRKQRRRPR